MVLSSDDYLELVSLNYKKDDAKYELGKLLKKLVDVGENETNKLVELLNKAKNKTDRLPFILMEFYYLYRHGYNFLQELGMEYGLSVVVPPSIYTNADTWDELTDQQQVELLNSFSPGLEREIDRVISLLKDRKIVLTGEQDKFDHYEYRDLR